jgi:aspartyl-tRNA(Asn)/glutamyl-tRNA(Gln) amidotransferase subunit A
VNIELATVWGISEAVGARQASAEEIARATIQRIAALEPRLNAFVQTFETHALEQARRIDLRIAEGEVLPLAGVPVAVKDNLCLDAGVLPGAKTTAGSRILENFESPYTATAVQRLIDAGAVIVGKTNMDEFAMGSSGENSAFGPTRNPWDPSRVPGGSSSGSAAAVAAGMAPAALGSDTGGSIRQPAGLCGVVGVKPTYGRVSRYGLVAFASSLDQIGPMTRTALDAALVLRAISGADPHDATSAALDVPDFASEMQTPLEGLVLGVPRQALNPSNHPAIGRAIENAINAFTTFGARTIEVDLPHTNYGIAAYYILALAEASSNLARYDGVRYGRRAEPRNGEDLMDMYCRSRAEGFGAEVQRRIMLGTYALSAGYYDAYYLTALKMRRRIKQDYDAAFGQGCHAILMPATTGPAFRFGERGSDPLAMYMEDVYTVGANLAGLPAVAFPAAFAEEDASPTTAADPAAARAGATLRLPVGVQLIGPAWEEHRLLRMAQMFQSATDFHEQTPPL